MPSFSFNNIDLSLENLDNWTRSFLGTKANYSLWLEFQTFTLPEQRWGINIPTTSATNVKLQLPVNPENVSVSSPSLNEKTTVIGIGEINLQKSTGLTSVSFSSFFPEITWTNQLINGLNQISTIISTEWNVSGASNYNTLNYYKNVLNTSSFTGLPPYITTTTITTAPQDWVNIIENNRKSNGLVTAVFQLGSVSLNLLATIEEFNWSIDTASNDVNFSMRLQEYKEYHYQRYNTNPRKDDSINDLNENTGKVIQTEGTKIKTDSYLNYVKNNNPEWSIDEVVLKNGGNLSTVNEVFISPNKQWIDLKTARINNKGKERK